MTEATIFYAPRNASLHTQRSRQTVKLSPCFIKHFVRGSASLFIFSSLCACAVNPQPIAESESYKEARKNIAQLFSTEKAPTTLTYEEALARGIRYNYDYRIKLVNSALQAGQLRIAEFTMFPDLKTTGSLYTRNNDYATFGITTTGAPTDVLTSTPRTLRSMREGFTWNLLDFGMGYVRARQQSERLLIAEEESRKQLQLLAQDIRIAYWKAYSAQKLLNEATALQNILNSTEKNMQAAMADELVPKEDILKFRGALLGGDRQLVELSHKLDKALIDLKNLLKLPLDSKIVLKAPPASIARVQNLENLDFKKLDTISLILRPELRSQKYMERIAKFGVKAAILQVFPGITLNEGWNYNSNKFLLNNIWLDKSVDVSWSLLNLVSLPTNINTANTQIKYEEMKSMALTLSVMTQTRYAYSQYVNLAKEYAIAKKQADNAEALYTLTLNRNIASMASKQQVVYAKLQSMIAKMDRDLILADLSTALGELYLSAGFDVLPLDAYNMPMDKTLAYIRKNFDMQDQRNFSQYVNMTYDRLIKSFPKKELPVKSVQFRPIEKDKELINIEDNVDLASATNSDTTQPARKATYTFNSKPVEKEKLQVHVTKVETPNTEAALAKADNSKKFVSLTQESAESNATKTFTLQIYGSYNIKDVKKMKNELSKTNKNVYYGCAQHNGKDWYVLTYGTYTSPVKARSSLSELPKNYQNNDAFARNTAEIKWSDCEPKSSRLVTVVKKSFHKSIAMLLRKDYNNYASTAYKKIISTWIA